MSSSSTASLAAKRCRSLSATAVSIPASDARRSSGAPLSSAASS